MLANFLTNDLNKNSKFGCIAWIVKNPIRPGGEGGEGHPEGKFVRPTFFSQFGGADFENACYTGVQGGVWLQAEAEASAKVHDYFLNRICISY